MATPDASAPLTIDDSTEVMTGEAVALDLRPTSFVLRGAGAALDFIISIGLVVLATLAINSPLVAGLFDDAARTALDVVAFVFCLIVVPTALETATQGRSVGKFAVGARIVRDDGGAIGFRHAFIRALTGVLEIFMTSGGLAALTGLLNSRSKRLGDFLAGTYSQNERVARVVERQWQVPVHLVQWAATADVARLPDQLSRRVSQFLGQADRLLPPARARLGTELAGEVSRFVSPVPDGHPEFFLTAVMALRYQRELRALELEKAVLTRLEPALDGTPHAFPDRG